MYEQLLAITKEAITPLAATKWVCYAEEVPLGEDVWSAADVEKRQQAQHEDLGHRMQAMFAQGLTEGYSPIIIIGSDCPGLTSQHLENAFQKLDTHDLVLGPALDGGYYLLGLNYLVPELFKEIPWSSNKVLSFTLNAANQMELDFTFLPELGDVDEEADLASWPQLLR